MLSGGPASVYADGAPQLDPALFDLGIPVFGICYGFQAMARPLGGTVARTGTSEYGRTEMNVLVENCIPASRDSQPVWMSHGDAVTAAPEGFDGGGRQRGAPRWRRSRTAPAVSPVCSITRGDALPARPAGAQPVPARFRRHWGVPDAGQHRRVPDRGGAGSDR